MLNYVGTNAVITYNFEFCQMTRWEGEDNLKGYIRFDNSHYLTNISDTNLIGDGYVNLSDGIIYWRKSKYQEYYSYVDNTVFIKDYNNQESFARITYYDEDALVANLYKFYANIESGEDPGGGGGGDTPSTSVTDPSFVSIEHTELRCREKQQVRPSDHSQDWTDTDIVRDKEECDVQVDSCECGREYQWVSVGTICDGVNKCDKLKYQYKDECNGSWNDYSPLIYKIGDVIEYDSSECGTVEYKEEWSEPFCGSYLNDNYGLSLSSVNKYKIKIPYIKRKDEFVWSELNCNTLLEYELFYTNSFECGYKTTRTVSGTIETSLCGSVIKTKYPSLSGSVTDTYSYDVIQKDYQETAPYPTNTDDMTQDEWVWITTSTTYSVTNGKADCGCGYYTTGWTDTNVIVCGSELGSGYVATSQYKKYRNDKFCNGVVIEEGTEYKYDLYQSNVCACGYYTTQWENTEEYLCGSVLNEGAPSLIINSVQGNWAREGYTFTSNTISSNVTTIERIYFSVSEPTDITFTIDQSSEPCCDYLIISKLDNGVTNSTSTGSSSPNYAHWSGKTTGTISMTVSDTNEHFISLMYRKDGSVNSGRDNVIVTLGVGGYTNTSKYRKQIENKYCGGVNLGTTGNYRWIEYEKNSYDCGYKQYRWYDTGEDVCCGVLENSENSCTNYYKYNVEVYQVTEDGTNWNNVVPERYRYGSIVETNSPDCGYIPKLVQWKLICPDITYETAVSGDSCTICQTYLNAPTMYAIEKQQSSTDGGITWSDDYSNGKLITRTEKILKWKADKCGYTGDTFAWFIDKESRTCNGTNQVGTYYFKVSSDGGNTWTNVEGVEPEVRIIDKTNDDYLSDLDCSNTNQT